MTSRNNSKYTWNLEKLCKIYTDLENKIRTPEEEKELTLLGTLIGVERENSGLIFNDNTSFSTAFHEEFVSLFNEYYQYLPYIFEYYDLADLDIEKQVFTFLPYTEDEILGSVHDFYLGLDKDWFKYFNKIYKDRKDNISFETIRSFSAYFPSSDFWLANVARSNTIEDFVDCTHEYAHGIADQIAPGIKTYSAENILIELFPIVCQLLFLHKNNISGLQMEITKYINNYFKVMNDFAEEVRVKYNIAESFCSIKNARCLSRLMKKTWGINMRKEELEALYESPIELNINYIFPFIIALELIDQFNNDEDLFKYNMNQILRSTDEPLVTLKKLNINPNATFKH